MFKHFWKENAWDRIRQHITHSIPRNAMKQDPKRLDMCLLYFTPTAGELNCFSTMGENVLFLLSVSFQASSMTLLCSCVALKEINVFF